MGGCILDVSVLMGVGGCILDVSVLMGVGGCISDESVLMGGVHIGCVSVDGECVGTYRMCRC